MWIKKKKKKTAIGDRHRVGWGEPRDDEDSQWSETVPNRAPKPGRTRMDFSAGFRGRAALPAP